MYAVTVTSLSREGTKQCHSQFCVKKARNQIASLAPDSSVCFSRRSCELTNFRTLSVSVNCTIWKEFEHADFQ